MKGDGLAPPQDVDTLNALQTAGQAAFQAIFDRMPQDQQKMLTKLLTVDGGRARMILEEGLLVLQVYRGEEVQEIARVKGSNSVAVN